VTASDLSAGPLLSQQQRKGGSSDACFQRALCAWPQVGRAGDYVQGGVNALVEAKTLQKKSRKLMCCILILILIILCIIGGVIAYLVTK
jgi:SNARE domain